MDTPSLSDTFTLSRPDRRYWGVSSTLGSELRYMYSIGLLNFETWDKVSVPFADPANNYKGRGSAWFTFPTPPQSYNISEPAATNIVPTQDGGKFIERQGSIFKDIRISGTVGLRPAPVNIEIPGLTSLTGVSLDVPSTINNTLKDERGLQPKEITGLDDITFLRNIFRHYYDIKRTNSDQKVVMIWMYNKESEWYIVEPVSFTTSRSSANPLSWEYEIQLRTLQRFDSSISLQSDPLSWYQKVQGAWSVVGQAVKDISIALNQINNALSYIVQLPYSFVNDTLNLITGLVASVANLKNFGNTASNINRRGLRRIASQIRTMDSLMRQVEYGETDTGVGKLVFGGIDSPTGGTPLAATDAASLSIHRNQAIRALMKISQTAKRLHALDPLFSESKQVTVNTYGSRYLEYGEPQGVNNSQLDPNNIVIPGTAYEVEVDSDLRSIAKKYLGDEAMWKTLAILNSLKYPYIAATSSDGVLAYGDKILIPQSAKVNDPDSLDETLTDEDQQNLSPVVRKYGRDLYIDPSVLESSGGFDLITGQNGDLQTIEGIPNVSQGMLIKFSTEQGDLPLHPTFGARFPIGTKLEIGRVQEFAVNTRRTLLSDNRVDYVKELSLFSQEDALNVNAKVKLKQTNASLPISFVVRRS